MNAIQSLLAVIDAYREHRCIAEATASTVIFNDGGKIKDLRNGRDIGVLKSQQALQRLSDNWPDGAVWPADIPRPAPQHEDAA